MEKKHFAEEKKVVVKTYEWSLAVFFGNVKVILVAETRSGPSLGKDQNLVR